MEEDMIVRLEELESRLRLEQARMKKTMDHHAQEAKTAEAMYNELHTEINSIINLKRNVRSTVTLRKALYGDGGN